MKRVIGWLFAFVLLLTVPACALAAERPYFDYFESNWLPDTAAWLDDMNEKPILIIGEHHGVADNYAFYLDILRSLPDEHVQLVLEMPPSFAYLCARYLRSGDETQLKTAVFHLKGTFACSNEHVSFWRELKTLTDEGRSIDIIGIDQEFQLKNTALALLTIDRGRFAPALDQINAAGRNGEDALIAALGAFAADNISRPVKNDDDEAVRAIMAGLNGLIDNPKGEKNRDIPLYRAFVELVDPTVRTLCIMGGQHAVKTAEPPTLASLLLADERFGGCVAVAKLFYANSSYMEAASGEAAALSGLTRESIIVRHAKRQNASPAVYRLLASPLLEAVDDKGNALSDLFDYAVLFDGAKAAEAFKP